MWPVAPLGNVYPLWLLVIPYISVLSLLAVGYSLCRYCMLSLGYRLCHIQVMSTLYCLLSIPCLGNVCSPLAIDNSIFE